MLIISDGRGAPNRSVLALGMFDGVHLGHRVLIKKARHIADERRLPLVAVSFEKHPLSVIAPDRCPPALTTPDERAALLAELGVDVLYLWPFTRETMLMPPENYVGELVRRFRPTDAVCGYNHSYGRGGAGTPAFMSAIGEALGFHTYIVPRITLRGREVSSTAIREHIKKGEISAADALLGRPYRLRVSGGRLCDPDKLAPPAGRYRALFEQGGNMQNGARMPITATLMPRGRVECAPQTGEGEGLLYLLGGARRASIK